MIDKYRERVRSAAEAKTGEPVYNGSLAHAAVLAETMFGYAQNEILILSGELNPRVYGRADVVEQARLFLADPEHKVRVLVETPDSLHSENHPLMTVLGDKENAEVRAVPRDLQEKYEFHFMVMDGDSYRFEKDKREPIAIAAFGDEIGGANIKGIFDTLWSKSCPLAAES